MPTKHLLIKGKVQGVFFRATAKQMAERLGIRGWVKNTETGSVEAVVTGTDSQLAQFTAWCRQGPPSAIVTGVDEADVADETFEGFKVIRGE